ncbi:MAG TPA: putative dsRNA-binding protein [Candidatus Limnocylindria bacterium]|nr:putative dsRNA-binding protein [Candidatus Limnocylindria bacterium]
MVGKLFRESFGEHDELPNLENPKGQLQEFLQATSPEPPQYETISSAGPDHNRTFECAVFHSGLELARGTGRSKKLAESAAALGALKHLREQSAPVAAEKIGVGS